MSTLAPFANHLWQSTLFSALVMLATLLCRHNRAALRHGLWLAGSIKFLVPFAALAALGAQMAPATLDPSVQPAIAVAIDTASRPFAGAAVEPAMPRVSTRAATSPAAWPVAPIAWTIWFGGSTLVLAVWGIRWRRIAAIARTHRRIEDGREIETLRQLERQAGIRRPLAMIEAPGSCEPGVFGIVRPVLLWPAGIGDHLNADQLRSILAHEVAHVRRADTLAAAAQALVEALFWFHPLVWWIGGRLTDERERACDEEVLRSGSEPELYAETILTACRLYLQAPPSCVAGVASSNLRKRIEHIMLNAGTRRLTLHRKLLLAGMSCVVIAAPVAVGALTAPRMRAQGVEVGGAPHAEFEVASVKLNTSGPGPITISTQPGGRFTARNVSLRMLIQTAYHLQPSQIAGGPAWINADRFDVIAKGDDGGPGSLAFDHARAPTRMLLMVQALLAERFKLVVRNETRDMPIYALSLAHSDGQFGPGLRQSAFDCTASGVEGAKNVNKTPANPDEPPPCGIRIGLGALVAGGVPLMQIANSLSGLLDRTVVDRTALPGAFDLTLKWTPDQATPGMWQKAALAAPGAIDANGPSIFTAVQEQLGLKLEPTRGPVEMLVIVSAQQPPTDN